MKYLKMLGLAAVAAMAFAAFAASSASATTLEVGGVTKNASVAITAHIESATSAVLARTDGSLANTCKTSTVEGATEESLRRELVGEKIVDVTRNESYTGDKLTGAITLLTFGECTNTVHVHKPGQLMVEWIPLSKEEEETNKTRTNGTVYSENAEVTVTTAFGNTVNCKTGEGTHIGTLTGVKEGNATMDVDAVLNCGFLLPSATWKGSYTVTGALGVVP